MIFCDTEVIGRFFLEEFVGLFCVRFVICVRFFGGVWVGGLVFRLVVVFGVDGFLFDGFSFFIGRMGYLYLFFRGVGMRINFDR